MVTPLKSYVIAGTSRGKNDLDGILAATVRQIILLVPSEFFHEIHGEKVGADCD